MRILYTILGICLYHSVLGQSGGSSIYAFLRSPASARISAVGGILIADYEAGNVSAALANPAQLHAGLDNQVSFQHQFLPAGIKNGYVGFARKVEKIGVTAHGSVQYMRYGTFDQTDEFGNLTGTFKGGEVALQTGASYQLYDKMRIGANLKLVQSSLETYRSSGIAMDFGAIYRDTANLLTAGFVIKNAGTQISTFDQVREDLPLDIQIGITKKLRHLPFVFMMSYHHLNRWNLLYDDPNSREGGFVGGFVPVDNAPSQSDNFFRHLVFGGELTVGKNDVFKLRLGYNHQLKQEFSIAGLRSLNGFSFGFGISARKFKFDYSTTRYQAGGGGHHLGVATNLRYFSKGRGIVSK